MEYSPADWANPTHWDSLKLYNPEAQLGTDGEPTNGVPKYIVLSEKYQEFDEYGRGKCKVATPQEAASIKERLAILTGYHSDSAAVSAAFAEIQGYEDALRALNPELDSNNKEVYPKITKEQKKDLDDFLTASALDVMLVEMKLPSAARTDAIRAFESTLLKRPKPVEVLSMKNQIRVDTYNSIMENRKTDNEGAIGAAERKLRISLKDSYNPEQIDLAVKSTRLEFSQAKAKHAYDQMAAMTGDAINKARLAKIARTGNAEAKLDDTEIKRVMDRLMEDKAFLKLKDRATGGREGLMGRLTKSTFSGAWCGFKHLPRTLIVGTALHLFGGKLAEGLATKCFGSPELGAQIGKLAGFKGVFGATVLFGMLGSYNKRQHTQSDKDDAFKGAILTMAHHFNDASVVDEPDRFKLDPKLMALRTPTELELTAKQKTEAGKPVEPGQGVVDQDGKALTSTVTETATSSPEQQPQQVVPPNSTGLSLPDTVRILSANGNPLISDQEDIAKRLAQIAQVVKDLGVSVTFDGTHIAVTPSVGGRGPNQIG